MQNRGLKVLMMLLLLVQSVAGLATPCAMMSGTDVAAPNSSVTDAAGAENAHPACHESKTPSRTETVKCPSCGGDVLCATACSVASSAICSDSFWADIEHVHTHYQDTIQSITSPSPSEHYRPPKLS